MDANKLSNIVIGYAIEIHSELGPGLIESVYEQCLIHKLVKNGFKVQAQVAIPVVYGDVEPGPLCALCAAESYYQK